MKVTRRFIVFEYCNDYEQALKLIYGPGVPSLGVLDWLNKGDACTSFASRKEAQAAIRRTEFYRLAMGDNQRPQKKSCKIVPVTL